MHNILLYAGRQLLTHLGYCVLFWLLLLGQTLLGYAQDSTLTRLVRQPH